eukprot:m.364703 g.364703  ORF g.364703 m.364703 type:complete len:1720 (-) comp19970_c0_seq1:141-5300(-)
MAENGSVANDEVDIPNKVRTLFKSLDTDGSGYIEAAELDELLELMGVTDPQERAEKVPVLLQQMDDDGDGQITLVEFSKCAVEMNLVPSTEEQLTGMSEHQRQLAEQAWSLFADIDEDGSGTIDIQELEQVLEGLGVHDVFVRKTKAKQLMQELDEDGSGEIDQDEFGVAIQQGKFNFIMAADSATFGDGDITVRMADSGAVRYGKEETYERKGLFEDDDAVASPPRRATITVTDDEPTTPPSQVAQKLRLPDARDSMSPRVQRKQLHTPKLGRRRRSSVGAGIAKVPVAAPQTEEEKDRLLRDIFDMADDDQSGQISVQELYEVLQDPEIAHGKALSKENVTRIMETIDDSGDNQLDFEEFKSAFGHLFLDDPNKPPDIMQALKEELEQEKEELERRLATSESEKRKLCASYEKQIGDMKQTMEENQDISNYETDMLQARNMELDMRNKELLTQLHIRNDELEDLERQLAARGPARSSGIQFGQIMLGDDIEHTDHATELRMVKAELLQITHKYELTIQNLSDIQDDFHRREQEYRQTIELLKQAASGDFAQQIEFFERQVRELTAENEELKKRDPTILYNNIPAVKQIAEDDDARSRVVVQDTREAVLDTPHPQESDASISRERFNQVVHEYELKLNQLQSQLVHASAAANEFEEEAHRLHNLLSQRQSSSELPAEDLRELKMLREGLSGWRSERDALQAQVEMYKAAAAEKPDYRAELEAKYKGREAELKREAKTAQKELMDMKAEFDALRDTERRLTGEVARLREKLDEGVDEEEHSRRQQEKIFGLQEKLHESETSVQILTRDLEDTQFDVKTAQHKIATLESLLQAERDDADADLARMRQQFDSAIDNLFDTIVTRERTLTEGLETEMPAASHDDELRSRIQELASAWKAQESAYLAQIEQLSRNVPAIAVVPPPAAERAVLDEDPLAQLTQDARECEAAALAEFAAMQEADEAIIAEKIAMLESRMQDLVLRNDELAQANATLTEQNRSLESLVESMKQEFAALRRELDTMGAGNAGGVGGAHLEQVLETTLTKMRTMEVDFGNERETLTKRADEAEKQLSRLLNPDSSLEVEQIRLESELRAAEAKYQDLLLASEAKHRAAVSDADQLRAELRRAKEQLAAASGDLQGTVPIEEYQILEERVAQFKRDRARMEADYAELSKKLASAVTAPDDLPFDVATELSRVQEHNTRLLEQVHTLEVRLGKTESSVDSATQVAALQTTIEHLQTDKDAANEKNARLVSENERLVTRMTQLEILAASPSAPTPSRTSHANFQTELRTALMDNAVLRTKLAELEGKADSMAEYKAQIVELQAALAHAHQHQSRTTISDVTDITIHNQSIAGNLEAALAAALAERDAAVKTKYFIEEESDKVRHQLTQENGTLRAQLSAAQEAQMHANKTIRTQADELKRLTIELTKFSHERSLNRTMQNETHLETLHELSEIRAMAHNTTSQQVEANRSLAELALNSSQLQEEQSQQLDTLRVQLSRRDAASPTPTSRINNTTTNVRTVRRSQVQQQSVSQAQTPQQQSQQPAQQQRTSTTAVADTSVSKTRHHRHHHHHRHRHTHREGRPEDSIGQVSTMTTAGNAQSSRVQYNLEGWGDQSHRPPSSGPAGAYYFPVTVWDSQYTRALHLRGPVWLRVSAGEVSFLHQDRWTVLITWPLAHIKRYGRDANVFSFEVGEISPIGSGVVYLATVHMHEIYQAVSQFAGSK